MICTMVWGTVPWTKSGRTPPALTPGATHIRSSTSQVGNIYNDIYIYKSVYIYIYICIEVYTYVYIYIYIHTHVYIQYDITRTGTGLGGKCSYMAEEGPSFSPLKLGTPLDSEPLNRTPDVWNLA